VTTSCALARDGRAEIPEEPFARESRDSVERTRLLEEVTRATDDRDRVGASESGRSDTVELDHGVGEVLGALVLVPDRIGAVGGGPASAPPQPMKG